MCLSSKTRVEPVGQAEMLRDRIYGAHVSEYMEYLTEEDETKYKEHFAEYIKEGITFDDVEDMYKVGNVGTL